MTDLSSIPVKMQGSQPCCAEAAWVTAVEYYFYLKTGVYTQLSFRFLAALTASADRVSYAQNGTSPQVAGNILTTSGVCIEATYPSNISLTDDQFIDLSQIPANAFTEALNYKLPAIEVLTDISWDGLNAAIEKYKVAVTALYLDEFWYLGRPNPLPLPPPTSMTDPSLSKHCTLSYGVSGTDRYFRNSFGNTFGQQGDAYYTNAYQPYVLWAAVIPDMAMVEATRILGQVEQDAPQTEGIIQEIEKLL